MNSFQTLERDYKKAHDKLMIKLSYQVMLPEAACLLDFLNNKKPNGDWEERWHRNFKEWGMGIYRK